ncbi:MAG: hypothetical protein HY898_22030 [Deltaproteobacteria bacterium]|nr:hypothetical protein [Deltaproteobacteria bacterium]
MKNHSPLLGFNTNVRHKGKVFHIQTEDSGVKHPHIITHLFADGGRILKSFKTSYAEHLSQDSLTETVRTMMKDQHKSMFMALRDGTFDAIIDDPSAHASTATASAVPVPPPAAEAPPPAPIPAAGAPAPAKAPRPDRPNSPAPQASAAGPSSVRADPDSVQAWTGVRVDMDVLERAAVETTQAPNLFQPSGDMPPPPAAVLSHKRPHGTYRAVPAEQESDANASRYVPSRPAAIFASARPAEGGNVFGEEMISDKSLDEVILGFLAEEFSTNPGDKPDDGKR